MEVGLGLIMFLPGMERGSEPTRVGDVLAQRQASVDVENLVLRTLHGKFGILVNKTLCSFLEFLDGLFIPPVRVVSDFVVMPTGRVKCYRFLEKKVKDY